MNDELSLPKLFPVEQEFSNHRIKDIKNSIVEQFNLKEVSDRFTAGSNVAIAVGSRGISNLQEIVSSVVLEVKRIGAFPFIVPAMGSHGGATAEGQIEVLSSYGITEENLDSPIISSMETIQVTQTDDGIPLYFDKCAYQADAIILIARVKPHTDFKGKVESGMLKMTAIGLGKHKGAATLHSQGFDKFPELIPHAGKLLIENTPITLGVAIIENAYEDTLSINIIPSEEIYNKEPSLLIEAKKNMPRLCVDNIDILIIDEIGKDISGAGMDPNITGLLNLPVTKEEAPPPIQRVIVRDLTEKTQGNAIGLGLADVTTRRLVNKVDFKKTYTNAITSTTLIGAKIPLIAESDQEALEVALLTCRKVESKKVKIVWIKNTLLLQRFFLSETYFQEGGIWENIKIVGEPFKLKFNHEGNLKNSWRFIK